MGFLFFGKNAFSTLAFSESVCVIDCVAANGVMRFSVCSSVWATHFLFLEEKNTKKWIPLLLAGLLVLSLCACAGGTTPTPATAPTEEPKQTAVPTTATEPVETEPPIVTATNHITINGICVDDSYVDSDSKPLKMVYLLYTLTATGEKLKIDSKYTKLTIAETNSYESDHYASTAAASEFMPNYLYTSYITDVYVGESKNVMATFYVPEGDLAEGKIITVSDSQLPDPELLRFTTDEIVHYAGPEEIAQEYDAEGYANYLYLLEEADADTVKKVNEEIVGYEWWCYVNNTKYTVGFQKNNGFYVKTSLGINNSGTYSVRNGYLVCTYSNSDNSIKIPYTFKEDGKFSLDLVEAFDVLG